MPLWLIHGIADRVIGHQHSERLLAKAQTPKSLTLIPGGTHIEAMTQQFGNLYRDQLVAFFESALRSR